MAWFGRDTLQMAHFIRGDNIVNRPSAFAARAVVFPGRAHRAKPDTLQMAHFIRRGNIVNSAADLTARAGERMSGQSSADDERLRLRAVQLTGRQATCLALYYFDDLSLGQIASALHIHRTVVSQHLRYGRQKLSAGRLAPRRMRWAKSPMLIQMDIEALDELSPDYLRGRW